MKYLIFYSIVFLACYLFLGVMHEQVHVQINNFYGIDSRVEYFSHFPHFVTIAYNNTENCNDSCKLAHNINEAIGYPLLVFYIFLGLTFLIIITMRVENKLK